MESWPIAPDGYLPNSVVRSWSKNGKSFLRRDILDKDKDATNDLEFLRAGLFCFTEDEEKTSDEKDEEERIALLKESYDIQCKISRQNQQTSCDEQINEETQTEEICYNTIETLIPPCHENENKQPRQHEVEWKPCKGVTPPLRHLDERGTSSVITTAQPPVESPAVSADDVLSKQETRIASYIPPTEPKTLTPPPPKPPSPPGESKTLTPPPPKPPSPPGEPKTLTPPPPKPPSPPGEPKTLTPHPPKSPSPPREPKTVTPHPPKSPSPPGETITLTPHPPKSPSPPGEPDTLTPRPPKSSSPPTEPKTFTPHPPKPSLPTPEDPQTQPDLGLPEFSPIRDEEFLLSSTKYIDIGNQTSLSLDRRVLELYKKYRAGIKNSSRLGKCSTITDHPLASTPSTGQSTSVELKSDWRKNLHRPLQGFASPPAAREPPVESPDESFYAGWPETSGIPSLRSGEGVDHHRVLQKIHMKDTMDPSSFHFHSEIPLNAQQTFFTLNPCGKTQYGRLQFDWMRGHDKDELYGLDPRRRQLALSHLSRST